jgi:hypothetical protein
MSQSRSIRLCSFASLALMLMLGIHAHSQTATGDKPQQLPDATQPQINPVTPTNTPNPGSRTPAQYRGTPDGRGSADSLAFTYSGGRADNPGTSEPVNYDTMFVFTADAGTPRWLEMARIFQTFDAASHLLSKTQQLKNNGGWENAWKEQWQHNTAGRDSLYTSYYWDAAANTWQINDQANYNTAGQQIITISKIVDCSGVLWTADKDSSLSYDVANRIKSDCRGNPDNVSDRQSPVPGNTAPDSIQQGSVPRTMQSSTGPKYLAIE